MIDRCEANCPNIQGTWAGCVVDLHLEQGGVHHAFIVGPDVASSVGDLSCSFSETGTDSPMARRTL